MALKGSGRRGEGEKGKEGGGRGTIIVLPLFDYSERKGRGGERRGKGQVFSGGRGGERERGKEGGGRGKDRCFQDKEKGGGKEVSEGAICEG